jgi:hypothetical protein
VPCLFALHQIDRIYSDWGEYLDAMEKEFVVESCRLEGVDPTSALAAIDARKAAALMSPTSQQQFLDREKQEQLVSGDSSCECGASAPSAADGRARVRCAALVL